MTTTFTQQALASRTSWDDPEGSWAALVAAKAAMVEQTYSIVADQGSPDQPASYAAGWSTLLNPTTCPTQFLPYLATFIGATVPPGTDDATARSIIKNEQGFQRGSPGAIIAAAKRFLTGTQSCAMVERTPTPYHFQLVVRPEELLDPTGLTNAVNAVKPAGIQWTLIESDAPLLTQYTRLLQNVTAPLQAAQLSDVT